jgi:hypothetical protein
VTMQSTNRVEPTKIPLESSAARDSMNAMERRVATVPQLSRQRAARQAILIKGAYNGSCSHDISMLKDGWAALTVIESKSLDRLLIGTFEKAYV